MKQLKHNVYEAIGNTPLVELRNVDGVNPKVKVFGKLEGNNPGGSIKDRPAYYMIVKAEEAGQLTKDKIIVEPTSGNTGIALAMIGSAKGYKIKLFMPAGLWRGGCTYSCQGSHRRRYPQGTRVYCERP